VTDVVAKGSPLGGGGPVTRRQAVLPPASRRGARDGFGVSLRPDHDARISQRPRRTRRETRWARAERQAPCRRHVASRRGTHVGARALGDGDGAGRGRSTTLGVRSGPRRADPAATVACRCHRRWPGAAGMPAARNIPVRAWSPVGTGHHGALGLSYSGSDEVKYRR